MVFDLDGVIVDSWPVMRAAYRRASESCSLFEPPPLDVFRAELGRPLEMICERLHLPVGFIHEFRRQSRLLLQRHFVYDGVVATLQFLVARGVQLALNTGKDRPRTLELLAWLEIAEFFRIVVTGDDVNQGKPAPESLLRISASLDIPCADIAFVGDSPLDMLCARSAGAMAVAALWGFGGRGPLRRAGAEFEVFEPADIHDLVANLQIANLQLRVTGQRSC